MNIDWKQRTIQARYNENLNYKADGQRVIVQMYRSKINRA